MAEGKPKKSAPASEVPKKAKAPAPAMAMAKPDTMRAVEKKLLKRFWNKTLPTQDQPIRSMVMDMAKKYNLRPEALYASSYGEGLPNLEKILDASGAIEYNAEGSGDEEYPINGFFHLGVDTFHEAMPMLKKKRYIGEDFDYKPFVSTNEKGQQVHSAWFRNVRDGVMAKAAMYRNLQDQVKEEAAKRKVALDPDALEYLTMAGFNGGLGSTKKMLDEIAASGGDSKAFIQGGKTGLQQVHKHISPRMRYMSIMQDVLREEQAQQAIAAMNKTIGQPLHSPSTLRLGSPLLAILQAQTIKQ